MTNKQFDNIVRSSAGMEEFELTEQMKNRLRETIANPVSRRRIHKLTMRTVLLALLIVLMLSAVAYAAATNPTIIEIYTSLFGEGSSAVQKLNEQTVQTPDLGYELGDITLKITQAIFDGNTLYVTGTVSAKETSNVVIMADDYQPHDPANADFHHSQEDFSKAPTYQEVAKNKAAKLLRTGVWVEAEGSDGSYMIETIPQKDDTYLFVSEFPDVKVADNSIPCTITALQHEVTEDGIEVPDTRVRKEWTFTVPAIAKEMHTPVPTPVVTPIPEDVKEQALIVIGDSPDSKIAEFYKAAYPGAPVQYPRSVFDENGMSIATQMILDGTLDWDVMCVGLSGVDLDLLMERGLLQDLSGYDQLMGKVSATYPNIKDTLMKDGKLYALPWQIYSRGYTCGSYTAQTDVWTDLGFTENDIPQTIDDLCDFIDKWLDRPKSERKNVIVCEEGAFYGYRTWLLDLLMERYLDYYDYAKEAMTFDTELFTRLLRRIDEVSDRLKKVEKWESGDKELLYWTNTLQYAKRNVPLALSKDLPYLKSCEMWVYIVNPNSKHMEQAIAYVQCGLSTPDDDQRIWMYNGLTLMDLPNPDYEENLQAWEEGVTHWQAEVDKAKTESDLKKAKEKLDSALNRRDRAKEKVYIIDADDLYAYQNNIAPHLFFPKQRLYFASVEDVRALDTLKMKYLSNKMTDTEFVKALDDLAAKAEAK